MGIFLTICIICGSLFLITLFFADHDVSNALDAADHADGSIFSVRSGLLFGIGFGASGVLARSYALSMPVSTLIATISGIFLAIIGLHLTRMLQSQEGDSTSRSQDIIGRKGIVTHRIPDNGFGQVVISDRAGRLMYFNARSHNTIQEGENVKVKGLLGGTLTVDKEP